jgi:hypothetical protein
MSFGINPTYYKGAQLKDLKQLSYENQLQYLKTDVEVEGIRTTDAYVIQVLECTILEGTIKDVADNGDGILIPR